MPSLTQKTQTIRKRKNTKAGQKRKKAATKAGTPKFPIHQEAAAK